MYLIKEKTQEEIKAEVAAALGLYIDEVRVEVSGGNVRVAKIDKITGKELTFSTAEEMAFAARATTFDKQKKGV